jgi:hypothetical protein
VEYDDEEYDEEEEEEDEEEKYRESITHCVHRLPFKR